MATERTIRNLSPEKKALIEREYPTGDLHALAARLGYKVSTLMLYAGKLGVRRDKGVARRAISKKMLVLYKKAKLRVKWGLPSKIKRHFPLARYTRTQCVSRWYMKKRGYILGDPSVQGERMTIFYDNDTMRASHSEKTAMRHGFRIKELKE